MRGAELVSEKIKSPPSNIYHALLTRAATTLLRFDRRRRNSAAAAAAAVTKGNIPDGSSRTVHGTVRGTTTSAEKAAGPKAAELRAWQLAMLELAHRHGMPQVEGWTGLGVGCCGGPPTFVACLLMVSFKLCVFVLERRALRLVRPNLCARPVR